MRQLSWLVLVFLMASAAQGASFNCTKATSPTEKLICRNYDVSELDESLHNAYLQALRQSPDKQRVRKEQRQWLIEVRNACANLKCLKDVYQKRLAELQSDSNDGSPSRMASPSNDVSAAPETFIHIECAPKTGVIAVESRLTADQLPVAGHTGRISAAALSRLEKRGYYSVQRSDVRDGCTLGGDTYTWYVMFHDQQEHGACAAAEFWQFWFQTPKGDQFVYTLDGDMCIPTQPLLKSLRLKAGPNGSSMTVCASDDAESEPACHTIPVQGDK